MILFPLKPAHKPVQHHYDTLKTFHDLGQDTEGNILNHNLRVITVSLETNLLASQPSLKLGQRDH